jgi:hypothetical protein
VCYLLPLVYTCEYMIYIYVFINFLLFLLDCHMVVGFGEPPGLAMGWPDYHLNNCLGVVLGFKFESRFGSTETPPDSPPVVIPN